MSKDKIYKRFVGLELQAERRRIATAKRKVVAAEVERQKTQRAIF